jgi:predicted transcriptional regulator
MVAIDPNELEILQVLWEHGPLKPSEIQPKLSFEIKNSALRWQLNELVNHGHLQRVKVGKAFQYEARTPRENVFRGITRRLAEIFFRGSSAALLVQLIQSEDLSEQDMAELRRIAGKRKDKSAGRRKMKKD